MGTVAVATVALGNAPNETEIKDISAMDAFPDNTDTRKVVVSASEIARLRELETAVRSVSHGPIFDEMNGALHYDGRLLQFRRANW